MPAFSYAKAAAYLTDKDKERLAAYCLALADQHKMSGKIHALVAADLGSTQRTMECAYSAIMVKLRKNDCYADGADDTASATQKAKGKKRKADSHSRDENSGEDGSGAAKKVKKSSMAEVEDADDDEI